MKKTTSIFLFSTIVFSIQIVLTIVLVKSYPLQKSLLFFVSSLFVGISGLALSTSLPEKQKLSSSDFLYKLLAILVGLAGFCAVIVLLYELFSKSVDGHPTSDILLLIELMVNRFLDGEPVYTPTVDWKYSITPTYLPALWMPFILSELLNFDYRWIPVVVLSFVIFVMQYRLLEYEKSILITLLISALPWALWTLTILYLPNIFVVSVEGMNIAYYLLFGIAILSRNPLYIGISIALCIMSRYSLLLWLPMLAICYMFYNKNHLRIIVGISFSMILLFYIIPFLLKDITVFSDSLNSYNKAALTEWLKEHGKLDRPYHLFRGQGMAVFYYKYFGAEMAGKLKALQITHLLLSIGSVVVLVMFYIKNRHKVDLSLFLLSSLSLYFAFFYHFIQVPYSYLFLVPLFINLLLWSELLIRIKR